MAIRKSVSDLAGASIVFPVTKAGKSVEKKENGKERGAQKTLIGRVLLHGYFLVAVRAFHPDITASDTSLLPRYSPGR